MHSVCIYRCRLIKVVSYCDLSVQSMSVMGFQKKKFGWGVGAWGRVRSIQVFFLGFLEFI